MQGYNLIVVFNKDITKLLMCKRLKEPYMGLYNFVGGHIEKGENGIDAAYRELWEETAITQDDITLTHLMDFTYHISDCYVEVYVGRLNKDFTPVGDENKLLWMTPDKDFFDPNVFAGEGNIGHIIMQVEMCKDILLK